MQQLVTRTRLDEDVNATIGSGIFQPAAGLRSVLFIAVEAQDNAGDAVRDTALDLATRAERPVLLLDLAMPGNRHYRSFYQTGMVVSRRWTPSAPTASFAVLNFEKLHDCNLYVSRVTPDPLAFSDNTWRVAARDGLHRLHQLFGAIVIAAPDLAVSDAGLRFAPEAGGVVLVLRSGMTKVAQAQALRDRVQRAGGQIIGTVLTHCARRAARRGASQNIA